MDGFDKARALAEDQIFAEAELITVRAAVELAKATGMVFWCFFRGEGGGRFWLVKRDWRGVWAKPFGAGCH